MANADLVSKLQAVFRQKCEPFDSPWSSSSSYAGGWEMDSCTKLTVGLIVLFVLYLIVRHSEGLRKCLYASSLSIIDDDMKLVKGNQAGLVHIKGKEYMDSKKSVLFVHATWCGHCKEIKPKVEELATETPECDFHAIESEHLNETHADLKVEAFPMFVLFHTGKEISRVVGADLPKLKQSVATLQGL